MNNENVFETLAAAAKPEQQQQQQSQRSALLNISTEIGVLRVVISVLRSSMLALPADEGTNSLFVDVNSAILHLYDAITALQKV